MNIALIMSAGSSERLGGNTPKQYLKLKNKTVLDWSLEAFEENPNIDQIYLVLNKNYLNKIGNIVDLKRYKKFVSPIEGGSTRQESVFKALSFLWNAHIQDDDIILIHDAARPFISQKIIDDNISLCKTFGAANTAIKVVDSLCKSIDGITIYDSVERKHIFQSQTPQTFRFGTIFNAHQNAKGDVTDDVQLVASYGFKIAIVEGSSLNFKITTKDDLELAKLLSKKTA